MGDKPRRPKPADRRALAAINEATRRWVRDASDEMAAKAGMRFDPERADFTCNWIETYCRLYEGDKAGLSLELLPFQREFLARLFGWVRWSVEWRCWVRRFTHGSFWGAKKNGKAVALDTEVPTPNGWRRFGDLEPGDRLFDETGAVCRIVAQTPVMHDRPCYEVVFSDGTRVVADANHLWRVESLRAGYKSEVLTTVELVGSVDVVNCRGEIWAKNYRIPVASPIQTADVDLPIPPYTLGVWLGDGESSGARVVTADHEVLAGVFAEGEAVGEPRGKKGAARNYNIGGTFKGDKSGRSLKSRLRAMGLRNNKHIPEVYKFASEAQRLALLRGLMDTDGTVSKAGQCVFTGTNLQLVMDVAELVASLGWKPSTRSKIARCQTGAESTAWEVQFWGTADRPCVTIPRKASRLKNQTSTTRARTRHIVAVRPVASVPVRCIEVDSPSNLFLITRSFIPTHNSPLCAATELYMLCGDGEPGQKVYTAAANGDQAKIAQRHAFAMVEQSPELGADCKLHGSTLQITHLPSRSIMMILTGDDTRGAKAKEGLNGSVFVDECHVVNREMMERTGRAGISRKEPLNVSFSTAGDDPSSYGYERCRYGRQVAEGKRLDPHFLHVEYSAPKGLTESQIDADIEAVGKAANPAWGTLVKPTEFRADWERSKGSQREVARFKQYRCNLWIGSTNQWLDPLAWERAGEGYSFADLEGRECYGALDLSRTRDLTSFVLVFPWPEGGPEVVLLWPMFWMPEQTAKERDHLFPFITWGDQGHITLTKGGVVDYALVKKGIREALARVTLRELFYDEKLANELTQTLVEGERVGDEVIPGIGCERTVFPQNIVHFTGPCKEFERRISAGLIRHPNNPVLTWQVGHCEVYRDANNNVRPVKPEPHSGKSVDGVVAAVMALAGAVTAEATGTAGGGYETW